MVHDSGLKQFSFPWISPVAHGKVFATRLRCYQFGAKIILLHATYLGYIYAADKVLPSTTFPVCERLPGKDRRAQNARVVRSSGLRGRQIVPAFTDGSPVIDICAFAKDHDVDLIITSTQPS